MYEQINNLYDHSESKQTYFYFTYRTLRMYSAATQPLTVPEPDGSQLTSSPKLEKLYTEISSLTMIEVSEFTELLKVRLNLKDIPMGAMVSAPAAAGQVNSIFKKLTKPVSK